MWALVVSACTRSRLPAARWDAVTGTGAVNALCAAVVGGGNSAAYASAALLAAARAVPRLRAPLLTTLLHMDSQAHAHGDSFYSTSTYPSPQPSPGANAFIKGCTVHVQT